LYRKSADNLFFNDILKTWSVSWGEATDPVIPQGNLFAGEMQRSRVQPLHRIAAVSVQPHPMLT